MTKKLDTTFIQIVHPVCCGLDVHKKKISACLITMDEQGKEQYEIKEFGTFTNDFYMKHNTKKKYFSPSIKHTSPLALFFSATLF
ncbi:MAG: IS110 family transposase [Proteobacteria bacterium]|nr:IS110 family transposase [Pseudomonadota bacterium]MBU1697992.1 IS110 family transposase [Pseudomonadota bacterium]